jgi:hypothetical protein
MSTTPARSEAAGETPRAQGLDMKLEVVVIPVSDVDRAKRFYSDWVGGSTPISSRVTRFGAYSSRLQARRARSTSAQESHWPSQDLHADFISSCPISR